MTLAHILGQIAASTLAQVDKRMLYRYAVMVALGSNDKAVYNSEVAVSVDRLAECLAAVGAGKSVSAAKQKLRQHSDWGKELAKRMGKLSKVRNGAAHPDVGLASEILAALSSGPGPGEQEEHDELYSSLSENTPGEEAEEGNQQTERFHIGSLSGSVVPSTVDPFERHYDEIEAHLANLVPQQVMDDEMQASVESEVSEDSDVQTQDSGHNGAEVEGSDENGQTESGDDPEQHGDTTHKYLFVDCEAGPPVKVDFFGQEAETTGKGKAKEGKRARPEGRGRGSADAHPSTTPQQNAEELADAFGEEMESKQVSDYSEASEESGSTTFKGKGGGNEVAATTECTQQEMTEALQMADMESWLTAGYSAEEAYQGVFGKAPQMQDPKKLQSKPAKQQQPYKKKKRMAHQPK